MNHQDWKTVVLRKATPQEKNDARNAQLRVSRASKKTDENPDQFTHAKVSKAMSQQIAKGRIARKMTQKDLAVRLNLPVKTVQQYESGKAIPKGNHIAALNRALGIRIVRDDKRK